MHNERCTLGSVSGRWKPAAVMPSGASARLSFVASPFFSTPTGCSWLWTSSRAASDVDGVALCRMFNTAISTRGAPKYLSSENDPLFQYHQWQANLRILDIVELKSIPYTPCSHPFIERLIGTICCEFLDHILFWNAGDLVRKLADFQTYYNHHRTHSSLGGDTPNEFEFAGEPTKSQTTLNNFRWQTHCRGLYQLPAAA